MSMHKIPLTELERSGLKSHGLDIGTPSQLSDVFRHGVKFALAAKDAEIAKLRIANEQLCGLGKSMHAELAEQCRLLGIGGSREARLSAQAEEGLREIARLRAENESSKIAYEQSTKACHDLTEKVIPNLRAALNKYSEDEVLCAKDAEIATLRADADTR